MRRTRVLSLLLCALVLAACQDDAAKLAQHLERGDAYIEEEHFNEAIIEFKSALQLDPNQARAHYKLAHAYFGAGKPRDGFWELRETVRLDPSNHEARIEFSRLAILAGEAEEALKQMQSLIAEDPSNVTAHLLLGQAYENLERIDEANEAFKKAYEVDPENQGAMRSVIVAFQRTGDLPSAMATLDTLLEKHPTFQNFSLAAGALPLLMSDEDALRARREELLKKSIEVAEGDDRARAYEQLTSFYVNQDRTPDAFALLEKAAETEEDPVGVLYLLARLHRSEGDTQKADELLERATAARPDDPDVYLVLAAYRVRQDDFEGALEAIERALEIAPDAQRAKLQKAEVLMELGFRRGREGASEEAREILDSVLAAEPANPFALVADAKYKLGTQDMSGATRALRAALEVQPNWAQAYYLLGIALAAQKDFAGARTELAKSLELDSSQLRAKATLAEVHFRLGEWSYCVDRARDYLKEAPDDTRVRLLLAQSLVRLNRMEEAEKEMAAVPEEERSGDVYFALGRIRLARHDPAGARKFLLKANEALPNNWEVLQALLVLDRTDGRIDESKQRIAAALEAEPDNAKLHQLSALVAFNEGHADVAEKGLLRAIEIDPEDLSAYERLARLYANTGRLEQTTATYEKALEVDPESAMVNHFLGVLYELSGDKPRAIERYEAAIQYRPNLAEAKNNLAYLYASEGTKLDRALDLAQDAKALLPDNPSVSDTLGWVLYKRGVPAAAVSYLKEAESRTAAGDYSIGEIRYHLALALEASGEPDAALEAVERALGGLDEQRAKRSQAAAETGTPERSGPAEPPWAVEARELRQRLQPGVAVNP